MADPTGTYRDGSMKFGSQVVIIKDSTGTNTNYIAEEFSLTRGANWSESKNAVGVPNKQLGISQIPTGVMTLQFETENTKEPKLFAEFVALGASGNVTLIVSEVGEKYTQDGEAKINVTLRAKINLA
jgi:hypothetical protein